MKKFIKPILYSLIFFLTSILILTIINYFSIVPQNILNILKIGNIVITFFISGYMIGKASLKKGWLNGISSGGILLLFVIIISIIFRVKFNIKLIPYYIILLLISTLGSIIGINKKRS